jgi:cell shape-determining protein MreD
MNTPDSEAVAARSDDDLLALLANPNKSQPEIVEGARAQLRERGVLVGVGGWLRFLSIFLTILVPMGVALQIVGFCIGFYQDHGYAPSIGDGELGLPLLLYLLVAIFAIVAGSGLWQKRNNAVGTAKKYFVSTVVVSFVHPFASYFTWNDDTRFFSRPAVDSMILPTIVSVAISIFWAVIWIKYLDESRRVRNTFIR